MRVTAKVNGFREVELNIAELQQKLARGGMRGAITKAARLVTAKAKALAPVSTGLLKKSIRQKVITNTKKNNVTVVIGPSNNVVGQVDRLGNGVITTARPAKYGHLVEYGTAGRGSYGREGVIIEPGNPPQPFMRPAWEATRDAAAEKYKSELAPEIQKVAARIRKSKTRRKNG